MAGILHGVGVGPGDPELVTVKAARILAVAPVIAWFSKKGSSGRAMHSAEPYIGAGQRLHLVYPVTTEVDVRDPAYGAAMSGFYDSAAETLAVELEAGRDVAVICEGDPMFYGSYMHLHLRLKDRFATQCIAGVTGMSGCWSMAQMPMTFGDDVLSVLPGTMLEEDLTQRLKAADAAVIMKIGRNFEKVKRALQNAGLAERAVYVERGSWHDGSVKPLLSIERAAAPYFSIILVPGEGRRF
jgi:precorrin-2/cobalt-factor-2 C20-methyltransferase